MKGDFGQEAEVYASCLKAGGKQDQVGDDEVQDRPDDHDQTEGSQSSYPTNDPRKEPELCNHGIKALNSHHESNGFGRKGKAAGEFEWQRRLRLHARLAEKGGHERVKRNTVACQMSVGPEVMHN